MKKVAVLQFPGNNSEYETARSVTEAGMEAQLFRWNDDPKMLNDFDGFILVGGFSYEDRGRAGLIASMDPVMDAIKEQAAQGKPVLGICNGAQMLVESGLVPGGKDNELLMCLARNRRIKDGELLGTGFYNENVNLKSQAPKARTAFTIDYDPDEIAWSPVAHGEGRFTTASADLFKLLNENNQIIFRYSDEDGNISPEFPINPNGAMENAAAIANPKGNVMAIMPHPERAPKAPMLKIFTSMRKYMEGAELTGSKEALTLQYKAADAPQFHHQDNTLEYYVQLIITDNEAQTVENALRLRGFDVKIRKWMHYEVQHAALDQESFAAEITAYGELYNSNKETATVVKDDGQFAKETGSKYFLVRDHDDSTGDDLTHKIHHHYKDARVKQIRQGWVWEVTGDVDMEKLLATNVFANPHAQELFAL